jgi:hypothetical protein
VKLVDAGAIILGKANLSVSIGEVIDSYLQTLIMARNGRGTGE